MSAPLLSVVVACSPGPRERAPDLAWLDALAASCAGLDAELLLVGFEGARVPRRPQTSGAPMHRALDAAGPVVPDRWAAGLLAARGRHVAFTTDLCVVDDGWARAAVAALEAGAAAVGGPISPAASLSSTGRAVHALRFGRLPRAAGRHDVDDVAADNAAYARESLLAHAGDLGGGFWEVEANRRLRAARLPLVFDGAMSATFTGGEALGGLLRQRFRHGIHAGAWRVATGARRPAQIVLAAPAVPAVLLARTMRASGLPGAAVPHFLALATAWAAGEVIGATRAHRQRNGGARMPK